MNVCINMRLYVCMYIYIYTVYVFTVYASMFGCVYIYMRMCMLMQLSSTRSKATHTSIHVMCAYHYMCLCVCVLLLPTLQLTGALRLNYLDFTSTSTIWIYFGPLPCGYSQISIAFGPIEPNFQTKQNPCSYGQLLAKLRTAEELIWSRISSFKQASTESSHPNNSPVRCGRTPTVGERHGKRKPAIYWINVYYRSKFRSQTSDSMDRWKAEMKSQRRE